MVAVVWFRHDLRLTDHPALDAAIKTDQPILPLYIYDQTCSRPIGGAAQWWLHHSLIDLQNNLKKCKADLILRQGNALDVFKEIHKEIKISHIFWHHRYDQEGRQQDQDIEKYFTEQKVEGQSFNGSLMFDSKKFQTKEGNAFKVFSPFWKFCVKQDNVAKPLPCPISLKFDSSLKVVSEPLDSFKLLPTQLTWTQGIEDIWTPGEQGAQVLFTEFLDEKLSRYKSERDQPAALAISDLSPHIHWGEISPRQLWHRVRERSVIDHCEKSGECFLKELGWRDFSYYTLLHYPKIATQPLKKEFEDFPWTDDKSLFQAWTKGQTGYPLVDAGMRQLWQTGYMHNRLRLVVASFLIKDLFISWQEGEKWFWDTLVDADLANNPFNWQWVAGCGTDASPYFRVFNPILQSKKFDAQGKYIREWVPELCDVPDEFIHEPWLMENKVKNYPSPIVDHYKSRDKALHIFETMSKASRSKMISKEDEE
ncbi:MAG: cryptochrome/photolyase family protein [Janthinobacterium lividum]